MRNVCVNLVTRQATEITATLTQKADVYGIRHGPEAGQARAPRAASDDQHFFFNTAQIAVGQALTPLL
jgi:hypothetical protein